MKKNRSSLKTLFMMCAAICWWGMLYPELALTPDTYRMICEEEEEPEEDAFWQLVEQGEHPVRFRSRFLEQIEKWLEKVRK